VGISDLPEEFPPTVGSSLFHKIQAPYFCMVGHLDKSRSIMPESVNELGKDSGSGGKQS